jgi:sigma-B regulation protein RsbU (phosphoserine phosphatase)
VVRLNELAGRDLSEGRFVTMFLGELGPAGRCRYVSAGHGPLVYLKAGDSEPEELVATDPPLGVLPSLELDGDTEAVEMRPGDVLVVTTDGLAESRRADGEIFGQKRLAAALGRARGRSAAEIAAHLVTAESRFRGEAPRLDDVTMVVIKRAMSNELRAP